MTPTHQLLARGLQSSRSFKLPTTAQVAAAAACVPLPADGLADGGAPYTGDELELMLKKELAHEMGVDLEELQ